MDAPYVRFVMDCPWAGGRRLYYGRRPDAGGWSRVVGWHSGLEAVPGTWTRALGAGIVLLAGADVTEVTPLERLPQWADTGIERS
jgi:hypothetical protein